MTRQQYERLSSLRAKVADAIRRELEIDGYCKSYEGTWELMISFPNYFDDYLGTAKPDFYRITLHCYVLGPGRHYDWDGNSWDVCLDRCEKDIEKWCGGGVA